MGSLLDWKTKVCQVLLTGSSPVKEISRVSRLRYLIRRVRLSIRRTPLWIKITLPLVMIALFAVYIWYLYGQLQAAFSLQDDFNPTRIYSDVTRIAAPNQRRWVEDRLRDLNYPIVGTSDGRGLQFKLRPILYPAYLIPESHPQLTGKSQQIILGFEAGDPKAPLKTIQINGIEAPDLYLEPQLVATLSRTGENVKREIRDYVAYDNMPPLIWQAIIAIEDQHFLEHKGFDPRGIARAILVNLRSMRLAQGGSTLTQQLVKNLLVRRSKNIFKKINELFLALILEAKYEKEQILERYLNEVYLGQIGSLEIHGVSEGARHFFNKKLDQLNLAEIALMAGLIRGPGYYSPYRYKERAFERQRLVLRKMVDTGYIAEEEAQEAAKLPVRLVPPQPGTNKAPYFTDFVKAELIRLLAGRVGETEISAAGFRVYTTLDVRLNQLAQTSVANGITDLEARYKVVAPERLEGALASVDHKTGFIRALVGGRSYAQSNFNRILNMKRQVGSTFKPLAYLTAFRKGTDDKGLAYGPAYPVEDAPWTLQYDGGKQAWNPKNYDKDFLGWIPMRKGLALSINTISAHLGFDVGYKRIIETARAMGVESYLPAVPSLPLGVAELSPVELLRVYATLANRGTQPELAVIRGIVTDDNPNYARLVSTPKAAIEPGAVDLLTSMLQSIFTEGTAKFAKAMGFDRPAAGKTGTTSHHKDAWFAGYTPEYTTVVWVGMDIAPSPTASSTPVPVFGPMGPGDRGEVEQVKVSLTGASAALPIWVGYMKGALAGLPVTPFPESPELVQVQIDLFSGKRAKGGCPSAQVVTEWYQKNFVPTEEACEIQYPPSIAQSIER